MKSQNHTLASVLLSFRHNQWLSVLVASASFLSPGILVLLSFKISLIEQISFAALLILAVAISCPVVIATMAVVGIAAAIADTSKSGAELEKKEVRGPSFLLFLSLMLADFIFYLAWLVSFIISLTLHGFVILLFCSWFVGVVLYINGAFRMRRNRMSASA